MLRDCVRLYIILYLRYNNNMSFALRPNSADNDRVLDDKCAADRFTIIYYYLGIYLLQQIYEKKIYSYIRALGCNIIRDVIVVVGNQ